MHGEMMARQQAAVMDYIDAHREEMLALWKRLVSMESPSADKAAVDRVAAVLAEELAKTGTDVRLEPMSGGDLLVADWNTAAGNAPVVFCGHMDTVFAKGTLAEMPLREGDGKLYGPGVLDMKGGLVIALYALKALAASGWRQRPIRVIFVGDEETGHLGSNAELRIGELAAGAAASMNFETGDLQGGLVVGRKGSGVLTLEVSGVSAHAGRSPEVGRSAILEMAHKIIAIQALNDLPNGTSVNVGVISGGTVVNAVPDACRAEIDLRFTDPARGEATVARIREIAENCTVEGTSGRVRVNTMSVAMTTDEKILGLFAHIRETARAIGCGDVTPVQSGGWSDACLIAAAGVPVVCGMGVRGEFNHTPREYAVVESLYQRAKLAATAVLRLT